ncbi:uncharacterized protein J8A68_000143 [[Candida] subhashii]|uniref:Zn(2)-C6 fungal-type domain-containing protein n=1 Tax=[Candida] subhashii TaxID=561895 RepID=A0A8J5QUI9_9ASCO|nr:uncharacterized protein J8A68_000143 [[Candida] subhashii]KAG7666323.1 hypothetical protein J8A68_000143 [[Candida] subhashii]
MEKCNYRSYQQVLNITVKPKTVKATTQPVNSTKKVAKPKRDENQIKRRTKTGCLTCRKRKKKCDEDKVNGKCQACTRNFLECCWPEQTIPTIITSKAPPIKELKSGSKSPILKSTKCDIKSLLATPIMTEPQVKSEPAVKHEPIPYPSPIQSPVFSEVKCEHYNHDVNYIALPPLFNVNYKLQSKDSNVRGIKTECIKEEKPKIMVAAASDVADSKEIVAPTTAIVAASTKFIITSFNVNKDLCQIPN